MVGLKLIHVSKKDPGYQSARPILTCQSILLTLILDIVAKILAATADALTLSGLRGPFFADMD